MYNRKPEKCRLLIIIINNNSNDRIFIQDNPSVSSTVINGVPLTKKSQNLINKNKQKCIKRKKNTIKSYKQSFETENSWKAGLQGSAISMSYCVVKE